jgi:hypothetical protein
LLLGSVDGPIRAVCESRHVVYSSWVDDLVFSGEQACDLVPLVIEILRNSGFRVAHKKIEVMRPGERKTINGLVLGQFVTVKREYLGQIRAGIHNLTTEKVEGSAIEGYVLSLEGQINYVRLYDPKKADRLRAILSDARAIRSATRTFRGHRPVRISNPHRVATKTP